MQKPQYVIQGGTADDPAYWSNIDGWVDMRSATTFTQEERDTLSLPAEWKALPGVAA